MSCGCDFDSPEFYNISEKKARKKHFCNECNSSILTGEIYEYVVGKWNGSLSTYKTCPDCLKIIKALEHKDCFCRVHGGLWNELYEHMSEATDFVTGEKFGVYRMMVNHRKNIKKSFNEFNS